MTTQIKVRYHHYNKDTFFDADRFNIDQGSTNYTLSRNGKVVAAVNFNAVQSIEIVTVEDGDTEKTQDAATEEELRERRKQDEIFSRVSSVLRGTRLDEKTAYEIKNLVSTSTRPPLR